MTENEFLLQDRVTKIKSVNEQYDLLNNAYISFSGGKDSTVLSALIDKALPGNEIPRVYINTGIEYNAVLDFVREKRGLDERFFIVKPQQDIKEVLEEHGYPFKSKEHSKILASYQYGGLYDSVVHYLSKSSFGCPAKLRYQFQPDFKLKVSDKCCTYLKKKPAQKWAEEHNKTIVITGIRKEEGGVRSSLSKCVVQNGGGIKFHPLLVVKKDFINWFIDKYHVKLCDLYYAPYGFKRTGCKGCPFSIDLDVELFQMKRYLPSELKQCEDIWKPVYEEYRRIGYRI